MNRFSVGRSAVLRPYPRSRRVVASDCQPHPDTGDCWSAALISTVIIALLNPRNDCLPYQPILRHAPISVSVVVNDAAILKTTLLLMNIKLIIINKFDLIIIVIIIFTSANKADFIWSFCLLFFYSFCHSVNRITDERENGRRPNLAGTGKRWPSRSY